MTGTVLRISWLRLRRDPTALVLTFLLPPILFSIFASVFGAMDDDRARPVRAALIVMDDHPLSARLAERFAQDPGIEAAAVRLANRDEGIGAIRRRELAVAVVVPRGFGECLVTGRLGAAELELLTDSSNPLATALVTRVLQSVALELGRPLPPATFAVGGSVAPAGAGGSGAVRVAVVDVLGQGGKRPSVAYFAAGIGVMFLLFTVCGRSAILLEERESGVLQRMLAARMSFTRLLLGRWMFLTLLGAAQVGLMFVWGSIQFGLDLWTPRHLAGFLLVTLATAATAASFGLLLTTVCRSRAQLNGISAVLILILSALGGSMFPRFLMPEGLQHLGRATFNAWALDGYQKVFWYEASALELWPELGVLSGFCVVFLLAARWLARGWQHA